MIAGKYNIVGELNCDLYRVFDTDLDLTSATIRAALKTKTNTYNFSVLKIDSNSFSIALLKEVINTIGSGTFEYDILIDDTLQTKLIKGTITINSTVTGN